MDMDFLLMQKMRMGDEKAVEAFVTKYYAQILRYCRLHVGDYGYAEDMTQETFERFFLNLKKYRHYGKAANYLYVIAGNLCKDFYRKNREITVERFPEGTAFRPGTRDGESPEKRAEIGMAFQSLPEEIREAAVLYFVQERKQKEIAEILGIGLPLVKYRIKRARELFTAYFEGGKEAI